MTKVGAFVADTIMVATAVALTLVVEPRLEAFLPPEWEPIVSELASLVASAIAVVLGRNLILRPARVRCEWRETAGHQYDLSGQRTIRTPGENLGLHGYVEGDAIVARLYRWLLRTVGARVLVKFDPGYVALIHQQGINVVGVGSDSLLLSINTTQLTGESKFFFGNISIAPSGGSPVELVRMTYSVKWNRWHGALSILTWPLVRLRHQSLELLRMETIVQQP